MKRHGMDVHRENVTPLAYDPLMKTFISSEAIVHQYHQDLREYFFPFKDRGKKMTRSVEPIEDLTENLNRIADLQDALLRVDENMSFPKESSASDPISLNQAMFEFLLKSKTNLIRSSTPIYFTGYACPDCKKILIKPMVRENYLTAKASHEMSCNGTAPGTKTKDDLAIQSSKDRLFQHLNSWAQQFFPSRRYIECLPVNFVGTVGKNGTIGNNFMSWLKDIVYFVDLGSSRVDWVLRAIHNKGTWINDEESKDFIGRASGSFAIFKVSTDDINGYYLLNIAAR
jgi:hypothetical protein